MLDCIDMVSLKQFHEKNERSPVMYSAAKQSKTEGIKNRYLAAVSDGRRKKNNNS